MRLMQPHENPGAIASSLNRRRFLKCGVSTIVACATSGIGWNRGGLARAAVVTDTEPKPLRGISAPGYLESYIDPAFGSKITRITGHPGDPIPGLEHVRWPEVARHGYSKRPAWNADGSLLILERCDGLILDGATFRPLFIPDRPGECRWHPTRPERMIFVKGDAIGTFDVHSGATEVVARFPGYAGLKIGPGEGNLSADGNRIALAGMRDGRLVGFAFDLQRHVKHPDIEFCRVGLTVKSDGIPDYMDWISISAGGEFVVVNGRMDAPMDNGRNGSDRTLVFNLEGRQVTEMWTEYGRPSHYDMTVDEAGDEVAVGVSKSPPDQGRVIKRRLSDGRVTVLTPGGYASHTSTRNTRRPGWAYVSYQVRGERMPYRDEIVAVKLDGSLTVERLAHLHTNKTDYVTESHGVPSPDGRKALWATNWNAASGRPVGACVLEVQEPVGLAAGSQRFLQQSLGHAM
jgi:hypothetical protein